MEAREEEKDWCSFLEERKRTSFLEEKCFPSGKLLSRLYEAEIICGQENSSSTE